MNLEAKKEKTKAEEDEIKKIEIWIKMNTRIKDESSYYKSFIEKIDPVIAYLTSKGINALDAIKEHTPFFKK